MRSKGEGKRIANRPRSKINFLTVVELLKLYQRGAVLCTCASMYCTLEVLIDLNRTAVPRQDFLTVVTSW